MTPPTEQNGEARLREKYRGRLEALARQHIKVDAAGPAPAVIAHHVSGFEDLADAILREFAIRPVASGTVGEGGEVRLG